VTKFSYYWNDPADRRDAYDFMTRPAERWSGPDDDESESRGRRPVTQAELDDYFCRGGKITYCLTPYPKPRRRPILSKARKRFLLQWAIEFDPLTGVPDAVAVAKQYLEIIKPTSRRNLQKRDRIKNVIEAALQGWTQADMAKEWTLDPGFLSRLIKDAYKQHPNLKPALRLLNLLNLQAKRDELSSSWLCALQWGDGNSEQGEAQQPSPYAEKPNTVKLVEVYRRAFPQPESNYCAMVDRMASEAVDVGTQRVLRTAKGWDKSYDDGDRTDYRAQLWNDKSDRLHDAIDEWHRLRRCAGMPDKPFKDHEHGTSCVWPIFDVRDLRRQRALSAAALFYRSEAIRQATIARLPSALVEWPPTATPWSLAWRSPFIGAPARNHGYLGPVGRVVSHPTPAPVRTNYYTKGFRIPRKLLPLSKLRGKGPRSKMFAAAVLNHGKSNINSELRKQFPEAVSSRLSAHDWKRLDRRLRESKWSKRPMWNPARWTSLPPFRKPHGLLAPFSQRNWIYKAVKETELLLVKQTKTGMPLYFAHSVTNQHQRPER
jgi:hypothetical protein